MNTSFSSCTQRYKNQAARMNIGTKCIIAVAILIVANVVGEMSTYIDVIDIDVHQISVHLSDLC